MGVWVRIIKLRRSIPGKSHCCHSVNIFDFDDSEILSGEAFLQELVAGSDCNNNFDSGRTTLQSSKILQLC